MATAYLALGSNLGDRREQMRAAVRQLVQNGVRVRRASSLYESEPMYELDQPHFLNAVLEVQMELSPEELLSVAKTIERRLGRQLRARNGPREIDIDLLDYEGVQRDAPELILPHPRMQERSFVLVPLSELTSELPLFQGETIVSHPQEVRKVEGPEWAPA